MTSEIQFIQNHQPPLKDGTYVLDVTLENLPAADDPSEEKEEPQIRAQFTVSGERFTLKPADFQAVFPPAGSLGDHSNVLPHIILNRSTLPWERQAVSNSNEVPWLALLLFDEGEAPKPEVKKLCELNEKQDPEPGDQAQKEPTGIKPQFPPFDLEPGQDVNDPVTIIDVPRRVLQGILPSGDELKYLAHVRQGTNSEETAVIIGSRLPRRGGTSVVHLVSLEGRYRPDRTFNYQDAPLKDGLIRLVSLYTWRFACEDEEQDFSHLLQKLDYRTLRLPENPNISVEGYLALGCVPLPHIRGQQDKINENQSWYHGPLLPGPNMTKGSHLFMLPGRDATAFCFNLAPGVLDVSYAAAWELGRFMALQNSAVSTGLFNWKRSSRQKLQQASRLMDLPGRMPGPSLDPPGLVKTWFEQLALLEEVPFNYLVPDERMLPPESIRFFYLDGLWLECLQEGALSLGRVTKADHKLDSTLKAGVVSIPSGPVTGFLIRSEVVAGWPGLLVDGYSDDQRLSLLRMDRLSKSILLCLFNGELKAFDFHLKPETMHFGVSEPDEGRGEFYKKIRNDDGSPGETEIEISWSDKGLRVIDIAGLTEQMKAKTGDADFTSAQFAFHMIEGVKKVPFVLRSE